MSMTSRRALRVLHDEIDARVSAIVDAAPSWPCRRGCDHCCRSLAEVPRLTGAEWELLREGLEALSSDARAQVRARLERGFERTCPLLDPDQGACLVYAHRPIACRAYGFYAARDGGLWCDVIEARVSAADVDGVALGDVALGNVVFGNHEALDRALAAAAGPSRSLLEWLAELDQTACSTDA